MSLCHISVPSWWNSTVRGELFTSLLASFIAPSLISERYFPYLCFNLQKCNVGLTKEEPKTFRLMPRTKQSLETTTFVYYNSNNYSYSEWPTGLRLEVLSPTQTPRPFFWIPLDVRKSLEFILLVLSCVGWGTCSSVQRVLPTLYKIYSFRIDSEWGQAKDNRLTVNCEILATCSSTYSPVRTSQEAHSVSIK
jgi:hypothetical protein